MFGEVGNACPKCSTTHFKCSDNIVKCFRTSLTKTRRDDYQKYDETSAVQEFALQQQHLCTLDFSPLPAKKKSSNEVKKFWGQNKNCSNLLMNQKCVSKFLGSAVCSVGPARSSPPRAAAAAAAAAVLGRSARIGGASPPRPRPHRGAHAPRPAVQPCWGENHARKKFASSTKN